MFRAVLSLCLSLFLVLAVAGSARAAPGQLVAPGHLAGGAVIPVADASLGGIDEVFKMEPPHLLFLGGGIVAGLLLISPGLGVGDLFGVVLGVIGSEFLYQTSYRSSRWF